MNDDVVVLGIRCFGLSAPVFVLAGGLAIFAYERAEARARARADLRWLWASAVVASLFAVAIDLRPADGFRGLGWLVTRGVLALGALGLLEVGAAWLGRRASARRPNRGMMLDPLAWLRRRPSESPRSRPSLGPSSHSGSRSAALRAS